MTNSRIEKRREKKKKKKGTNLQLKGFVLRGIALGVTREVIQYVKELLMSS